MRTYNQVLEMIASINYWLMANNKEFRLNLADYQETYKDVPELVHLLEIQPTGDMAVVDHMSGSFDYVMDQLVKEGAIEPNLPDTIETIARLK